MSYSDGIWGVAGGAGVFLLAAVLLTPEADLAVGR
jgi:ABC-type cobalamin transport system permease subunit